MDSFVKITSYGGGEVEMERFDFSMPENVLIHVLEDDLYNGADVDWMGFRIEDCVIMGDGPVIGAASYEQSYGGFLDYSIQGMIACPKAEGFFVVEGITGTYHKGDGWMTDDDMDFDYVGVRPATEEEIALYGKA